MSLVEHLKELRSRLLKALLAVAVVTLVVAVWAYFPIFHLLREPYCHLPPSHRTGGVGCQLIFTHPTDAFFVRLKISLIAGIVLSCPLWLYQLWAFITPGLHQHERRWAVAFIVSSVTLFAGGAVVAYFVLSPALKLLLHFAGDGVTPLLEVNQYIGFISTLLLIFGVSFEFPLVVVLLNLAGLVSSRQLRKWRRFAIFLLFVFAAVATPTQDPFSMLALAVPLCLLYEAAVLVTRWNDRRRARREAEWEAEQQLAGLSDDEASPPPVASPAPPVDPVESAEPVGAGHRVDDVT